MLISFSPTNHFSFFLRGAILLSSYKSLICCGTCHNINLSHKFFRLGATQSNCAQPPSKTVIGFDFQGLLELRNREHGVQISLISLSLSTFRQLPVIGYTFKISVGKRELKAEADVAFNVHRLNENRNGT